MTTDGSAPGWAVFADHADQSLPLTGVRVVDLTMNIAGPYCTQILGDLGAQVLKVERPAIGDDSRRMAPRHATGSAYFFAINRNKVSIALDIHDRDDRERLLRLVDDADVFVTNLRPASVRRAGLTEAELRDRQPELIYADINAYGVAGPEADKPGYDMVLQARAGLMSINGEPGGAPSRIGASILDMGSGLWLSAAILALLVRRHTTGTGGRASTSLLETGAAFMAYDLTSYQVTGVVPGPRGAEHPSFSPYGVFRTGGVPIAIGVGSDDIFARLVRALDLAPSEVDVRFATNAARVRHRAELQVLLEARLATLTADEALRRLHAADVPSDIVADTPRLLVDPQLQALRYWADVEVDGARLRTPGAPITLDGRRLPRRLHPPALPSHVPQPLTTDDGE